MPTLELRNFRPDDIEPLQLIVAQCGEQLYRNYGLTNWFPAPPINWIAAGRRQDPAFTNAVFGILCNKEPIGTFTYYNTLEWSKENLDKWFDPNHHSALLLRLAIKPEFQRLGVGEWCMRTIELMARLDRCQSIRLGAFIEPIWVITFYKKLGYDIRGYSTLIDWCGRSIELCLMEKLVKGPMP